MRVWAAVSAAVALGAAALGGCSGGSERQPAGDSAAIAACGHRGSFGDVALVAAFTSSVGTLRHWNPVPTDPSSSVPRPVVPNGPAFLQGRPDGETIYVCYVDGNVGGSLPPPVPAGAGEPPSSFPHHDRALLLIDAAGHVFGYVYGYKNRTPLVRPTASGA